MKELGELSSIVNHKAYENKRMAPVNMFYFIAPSESLGEYIASSSTTNPLGVADGELRLPPDWDENRLLINANPVLAAVLDFKARIKGKGEVAFTDSVKSYLNRFGCTESTPEYSLYQFRVVGLVAYALQCYLEESLLSPDEMVYSKECNNEVLEAAKVIKKALNDGPEMKSVEQIGELESLLGTLIERNTAQELSSGDTGLVNVRPQKKTRGTDYALRLMIYRFVTYFKIFNMTTPTELILSVAKMANSDVSDNTYTNYIQGAKRYLIDNPYIKKHWYKRTHTHEGRVKALKNSSVDELKSERIADTSEFSVRIKKKNSDL
ncbi:hypothetical protein KO507_13250 [Gilvimarinus agarilyticus]|uniref:hypothetical protein n=1 Tax=Gilvimarinus sp. 2_MG-2023 TaxID=3062666 RepID=UPI001C09483E|nr:hypothetical protein [Gilvimarinus sp. 2_MG-2023]MBU2886734.1 hypothetical protein [Gilvimarinus agarilyticus]MDO6571400.1 hypothetical protein [Gilvimarinus sp. 2_MG-2023]